MKINIPVRMKNPWFWVGIVSIALTAIGIDPTMFTSWDAVWDAIVGVVSNPFQLFTMILAVLAVFIDPTTSGITDSSLAMTYSKPKGDK